MPNNVFDYTLNYSIPKKLPSWEVGGTLFYCQEWGTSYFSPRRFRPQGYRILDRKRAGPHGYKYLVESDQDPQWIVRGGIGDYFEYKPRKRIIRNLPKWF